MLAGIEGIHAWYPPGGSGLYVLNGIRNPSFEANTNLWGLATPGWASNKLSQVASKFDGSDGSFVGRIEAVKDATATLRSASLTTNTDVGFVEPGAVYSAGLRMAAFDAPTGGYALRVDWYTAASVFISSSPTLAIPAAGSGVAARRILEGLTAPPTASFAQLALFFSSSTSGDIVSFDVDMGLFHEGARIRSDFPTVSQLLSGRASFTSAAHGSTSRLELPAIELGRLTDAAGAPISPRYRITRISGLRSQGTAEDNKSAKVGGIGENSEHSERRGKSAVYEGLIEAESLKELREAEDTLLEAFADVSRVGRMDVYWHELNAEFKGEAPKFYEAKCLTCDIPDNQETKGWKRRFVLGLWLYDPRHFEEETEVHTVEVKTGSTTYKFT